MLQVRALTKKKCVLRLTILFIFFFCLTISSIKKLVVHGLVKRLTYKVSHKKKWYISWEFRVKIYYFYLFQMSCNVLEYSIWKLLGITSLYKCMFNRLFLCMTLFDYILILKVYSKSWWMPILNPVAWKIELFYFITIFIWKLRVSMLKATETSLLKVYLFWHF